MADEDLNRLKIDKSRAAAPPRRRAWIGALLLAGALLAWFLWRSGLLVPAADVETVTVSRVYPSRALTVLNASGYVVAQRKAAVSSEVTGRLVWLGVEEGSRVREGEVIARLASREAEAARQQTEAELASARARVRQAAAEAREAELDLKRLEPLLAGGYVSQAEFDRAEARYRAVQAALAAARAGVETAAAALLRAEVALDYTRLRAPFDAVVLTKNADIGDIVTPIGAAAEAKAAVVTIADLESLQVEADVSESNLSQVRVGQPTEIELDALPDSRFPGEVTTIVPTADRTKATVLVKVRFLERDPRVLPEMSARVAFLERPLAAGEEQPRLAVPAGAVVERDGRPVVFRVEDKTAQAVPVATGMRLGDLVEVDGLAPGERIVLRPPVSLAGGDRVQVAGED